MRPYRPMAASGIRILFGQRPTLLPRSIASPYRPTRRNSDSRQSAPISMPPWRKSPLKRGNMTLPSKYSGRCVHVACFKGSVCSAGENCLVIMSLSRQHSQQLVLHSRGARGRLAGHVAIQLFWTIQATVIAR